MQSSMRNTVVSSDPIGVLFGVPALAGPGRLKAEPCPLWTERQDGLHEASNALSMNLAPASDLAENFLLLLLILLLRVRQTRSSWSQGTASKSWGLSTNLPLSPALGGGEGGRRPGEGDSDGLMVAIDSKRRMEAFHEPDQFQVHSPLESGGAPPHSKTLARWSWGPEGPPDFGVLQGPNAP